MNPNVYAQPRLAGADPLYDRIEIIDGTLQPGDGLWNSPVLVWGIPVLLTLGLVAYVVDYETSVARVKVTPYQYLPANSAAGTAAPAGSAASSTGKDAIPSVTFPAPAPATAAGNAGGTYPSAPNPQAIGAAPPNHPVPGAANTTGAASAPDKK